MPLFDIPKRADKASDKKIAQKLSSPSKKSPVVSKGNNLLNSINTIRATIDTYLGKYKDEYLCIQSEESLNAYMTTIRDKGIFAIDTETTGLNPLLDKIVGISIYAPDEKPAYIPLNHISYITNEKSNNQLDIEIVCSAFTELLQHSNIKVIMFNADFDIRVLRNQAGIKNIRCDWDCYLASMLLNENDESHALKKLHQKYVLENKESEFKYDELFSGINFALIPINTAYLYAAHDAVITFELYEFQKKYLYYDRESTPDARNGMNGVSWTFFNIEMPCISAVANMEDNGVLIDLDYVNKLSEKYHKLLDEAIDDFNAELDNYKDDIEAYRIKNPNAKLDNPINVSSTQQLAILLYDIIGVQSVDKKKPRGTGEDILEKIDIPLCKKILKFREISKLISTYIDKMPECVNPNDGRIHCRFNQYGAKTGRFSSDNPNLQNIPSHNKDIRKMFVASDGYVLMSSDFSQQEPKALAALCRKHGDSQMYDTFMQGKDLYSEIASKAFSKPYEECKEFNADGTTNKAGKERRTQAKSILLGVLYGRGVASIAEQLKCSTEKAQNIKDSVFKAFPAIGKFEQDSLDMAYEEGYVTTVCGRKRRLPDLQLDEYEFKLKDGAKSSVDVLDFSDDIDDTSVDEKLVEKYLRKLRKCKYWEKRKIFEQANEEGIWIVDNGGKIADATRQCVNARIQGSAADLTKLAMIDLNNDERLKELGLRLLIQVHDEVIAECPIENAKECSERLALIMSKAAEKILEMPIKCDVTLTREWYGEEVLT